MGRSTLSRTVRHGNRTGAWKTTPMSRRGPWMAVPRREAVPPEGASRPARILSKVDLPQPDGPTTATNAPSSMAKLIRSRAATPPARGASSLARCRAEPASVPPSLGVCERDVPDQGDAQVGACAEVARAPGDAVPELGPALLAVSHLQQEQPVVAVELGTVGSEGEGPPEEGQAGLLLPAPAHDNRQI